MLNVVEKFPDAQCWISFQCRDARTTASGEGFADVVRRVLSHPAAATRLLAIGVNCCDPEHVAPLLRLANEGGSLGSCYSRWVLGNASLLCQMYNSWQQHMENLLLGVSHILFQSYAGGWTLLPFW